MIVADASAILDLLLNRPSAARLRWRLFAPKETLHAPHLLDVEVLQVLRRHAASGAMTDDQARTAIRTHLLLPIERYRHELLLERAWEMRENTTAYDAVYVALAEALGAVFITADARLAKAVARRVRVEIAE